jgi:hypothetical protein
VAASLAASAVSAASAAAAARAAAGPRLRAVPATASASGLQLPPFIAPPRPALPGLRSAGLGMSGAYNDPRMDCHTQCGSANSPATARETLAGVAAAGVGAGVVLALIAPPRNAALPPRSPLTPGFDIDVAAQRLAASAVWKF